MEPEQIHQNIVAGLRFSIGGGDEETDLILGAIVDELEYLNVGVRRDADRSQATESYRRVLRCIESRIRTELGAGA